MSGTYTQQSGALTQQSWHLRPTHSELLFPRAQRNRTLSKRQNAVRIVTTYLFYPCISCFQPQLAAPSQAPADFILFHPFLRRYVKHATLIEKCFPAERLSESTPNSNELSYLVYYAQSKPAKLAKVGAYLAKRAKKDLQRRRRGDVIVGLRIFDELLEECGRDLNFFGKDVLGTLDATLREGDAEVVWAAARTFELFCRCHTGATLAIDTELRAMYTGMARTLVASKTPVGMRAIQAIVESQATYATDSYDELPGISQAILDRLAGSPALAPADDAKVLENQIMDIRKHVDSKPSEEMLGHWAWLCLETLMRRSHGQHSQVIIAEVFKYLDTRLQWQPATFCVSLVGSVIENLYSQDQNMVIVETLAFLTDGTRSSQRCLDGIAQANSAMLERIDTQSSAGKHSDGAQVGTKRRATTIRVLESLFCKPYILVGISVMEVLNILVTFLLESIGEDPSTESDFDMFSKTLQISSEPASNRLGDSLERLPTYYHLLSAIGGLAKHQYYSDQLADMVGYLIKQMKLEASTRADSLGTAADGARQAWLLQALSLVLANSTATSASGRTPMTVPLSIYVPLFTLLSRDQWDVRALAADCIVGLLRHDHQASDGFALRSSAAVDAWSSELAAAIRQKLSDALQHAKSAEGDADYAAVAAIMYELLATHVPATAQLVLELLKQSDSSSGDAGAMAMQAMVWQKIADECRAAGLDKVVIAVASEAKDSGSWSRHVEYACLGQTRIVAIATAQPAATTPGSPTLAQKLSYETLCTHLSLNLPDISPSDSQKADHVLLNHHQHHSRNTSSVTPEPARARKAVDRVNDMRARISIDWETQAKRDSALAPHVNMDQLRAALRTGLNMRSAEFNEDLENNADLDDDIGTAGRSLRTASTDYQKATAKDVDAYGVPVPDEVRALLDSLDESVGSPYHQHGGQLDHQTNSSISTPVVSHVD